MLSVYAGVPRSIHVLGIKSLMPLHVSVGVDSNHKDAQVHKCSTGFHVNVSVPEELGIVLEDRYLIKHSANVAAHAPSVAPETNALTH